MLGIGRFGRFGGIAGSFPVAEFTRRQFGFSQIFTYVAIVGVIATIALLIKQAAHPEGKSIVAAIRGEALSH